MRDPFTAVKGVPSVGQFFSFLPWLVWHNGNLILVLQAAPIEMQRARLGRDGGNGFMNYAGIFKGVLGSLTGLLLCCGMASANGTGSCSATRIIHYVPSGVWTGTRQGRCWTGSVAISRPDAWRCMVGNSIFDPCFTIENGRSVVCDVHPETGRPGFKLHLQQPLPTQGRSSSKPGAGRAGRGWLIELADGTFCRPATGTMGVVAGQPTTYYCKSRSAGKEVVVLGELDARQARWTAEKAILAAGTGGPPVLEKIEKVPVAKVWQ